nr:hypothetical protein Iba_chr10aCG11620 [Ipomoea batatas]
MTCIGDGLEAAALEEDDAEMVIHYFKKQSKLYFYDRQKKNGLECNSKKYEMRKNVWDLKTEWEVIDGGPDTESDFAINRRRK